LPVGKTVKNMEVFAGAYMDVFMAFLTAGKWHQNVSVTNSET